MSHDHVQGLDRLEGDAGEPSRQRLVQGLQAHAGHPFDGHFEAAVFALSRNGDLKLHLRQNKEKRSWSLGTSPNLGGPLWSAGTPYFVSADG